MLFSLSLLTILIILRDARRLQSVLCIVYVYTLLSYSLISILQPRDSVRITDNARYCRLGEHIVRWARGSFSSSVCCCTKKKEEEENNKKRKNRDAVATDQTSFCCLRLILEPKEYGCIIDISRS